MRKTIFLCGLVAGLISSSLFIGMMLLGKKVDPGFKYGMFYGYGLMILAFIFIFVGTKITRDKYNGGEISIGKAFLTGLYITLIASTIYVAVWLIDFYVFIPDFAEKYGAHEIAALKASGASEAELAQKTTEMGKLSEMYKNPLFIALLTYMEILPVGLIVSFISAIALKRKKTA